MKTIDLGQTVYTLCTQYPELIGILKNLGFEDITKPGMLHTAGRFMTIPKGVALKKLDMEMIKSGLESHGFKTV